MNTNLRFSVCADKIEKLYCYLHKNFENIINAKDSNHKIIHREKKDFYWTACGSTHLLKNKKTNFWEQKYICKDCNKRFSDTTETITQCSKKYYMIWKLFIECEISHLSLRNTSDRIGIATTNAYHWHQKIHKSIHQYLKPIKLSGQIVLDATYVKLNL